MVERMINMEGLAFLKPSLRRILPGLQVETDYGKQYVDLHPVGWKMLAEQEDVRPLLVKVWTVDRNADGSEQFGLALYYSPDDCSAQYAGKLRKALEQAFPELQKGRQTASYRTLGHVKSVSEAALEGKLCQLLTAADDAVRVALT
jgi:hypothetical protein